MTTPATIDPNQVRKGLRLCYAGLALAVVGALVAAAAGPSFRFGLLAFEQAVKLLVAGAAIGVAASLVGVVGSGMVRRAGLYRHYVLGWFGVLIGAGTFMAVYSLDQQASKTPPVHDITTDPANPPAYVALLDVRRALPDGGRYDAERNLPLQMQVYADINRIPVQGGDIERVFDAAFDAAKARGWEIVASDRGAGRIEAIATSAWWGLRNDVVVRVARTSEGNTRLDFRIAARQPEGDLGANAESARAYLDDVRVRLGLAPKKD